MQRSKQTYLQRGSTVLHIAAKNGAQSIVKNLIENSKIDVNAKDKVSKLFYHK